jgi:hypothetical protein
MRIPRPLAIAVLLCSAAPARADITVPAPADDPAQRFCDGEEGRALRDSLADFCSPIGPDDWRRPVCAALRHALRRCDPALYAERDGAGYYLSIDDADAGGFHFARFVLRSGRWKVSDLGHQTDCYED